MTTTPRSRVDTIRHAATYLECFAKELLQGSNRPQDWDNPPWENEKHAKDEYDDLLATARSLRELVSEVVQTANAEPDEAAIQRGINPDPYAAQVSKEEMAQFKPMAEVLPQLFGLVGKGSARD